MTTIGHKKACVVMLLFIAGVGSASATRFADSTSAAEARQGAVAEVNPSNPQEADSAPPVVAPDPDDPKFAGRFSGRVIGPDGNPVLGARIFIAPYRKRSTWQWSIDAAGPVRAKTDADGRFEFDAPDMTYTDLDGLPSRRYGLLIATADGFAPDWMQTWGKNAPRGSHWDPVRGAALDLQLGAEGAPIQGRLLDPDGRPVAGARIRLTRLMIPRWRDLDRHLNVEEKVNPAYGTVDYERTLYQPQLLPKLITEIQTDADGRFSLSGLGRDRIARLEVSASNVVDTTLRVMTRDAPDIGVLRDLKGEPMEVLHGANFALQLRPGRTIRGRVIDRDTREPVAGMWVGPLLYYGMNSELYPWITDENGRFAIPGLPMSNRKWVVMAFAAPGVPYQSAGVEVEGDSEAVIESRRGIPFQLKVSDENGEPVEATVTYVEVLPNPHYVRPIPDHLHLNWPNNPAARRGAGSYEGFVIPGPGAVLVKASNRSCRPAQVDPQAFFAADESEATTREGDVAFGTQETLRVTGDKVIQNDYDAILLVNPSPDSAPLELSATVTGDKPRRVTLLDPDGQPVVGTTMKFDNGSESRLRAASFSLTRLHPNRARRLKFIHEDRRLVAFLLARGDGDAPYTVRMKPWGTVIGRLVDENGQALPIWQAVSDWKEPPKLQADITGTLAEIDRHYVDADAEGRFRIDKLVPGQSYDAKAYPSSYGKNETAFEGLVLRPGEVRDLGDIRTNLSYEPNYKLPTEEDQPAIANIPAEAWGEPVNGLRVAIVLRSPPIDEEDRLRYDIVAENVSDRDIRFGAANAFEFCYYTIAFLDADGKQVPRQPGSFPDFAVHSNIIRCWLKPMERIVISPCVTKLVRLDAAGQPVALSKRDPYYHFVNVKPGRYSVSAAVELGSGVTFDYTSKARKEVRFAPRGEWTGTLETGVVTVKLFEDTGK